MKTKKPRSTFVAAIAASTMLIAFAPAAMASSNGDSTTVDNTVASSRSFKSYGARKDFLKESTATTVEKDSNWGGLKGVDVPQTPSQAEKDAAARRAADQAAARAAAATRAQAAADAAAASRSAQREALTAKPSAPQAQSYAVAEPNGSSAASVLSFAAQFVGKAPYVYGGTTPAGWDCSGFVMYVFAKIGISLPHSSGAQTRVGTAVADLSQARPGDIIASNGHAAIYIGNGMVVNALNERADTTYSSIGIAFHGAYSIRRLL
ncbi:MAG: NlpC/P60 family protein [Bifidobacterium sp.]|jgi:cell wall-associated NlpC family hydrolase|nr:NlpC/P60 family protein [Bifidobacterium sp.]